MYMYVCLYRIVSIKYIYSPLAALRIRFLRVSQCAKTRRVSPFYMKYFPRRVNLLSRPQKFFTLEVI